uniref:Uncharacterized protein n=1 Tax=Myoviridae sp. ctcFb5 TaxID=2825137 RepID=A0A8S5PX48_9CAUD|nr:MAG TPA: hypothetical protein [Myoviridae sp. ctcFb5]
MTYKFKIPDFSGIARNKQSTTLKNRLMPIY